MPNMIKLPLAGSGVSNVQPLFTVVNAEDIYEVEKAIGSGATYTVIHLYYTIQGAAATDFLRASIDYRTQDAASVVTDQDIENLRDMIISANQNPSSTPEFALIGARDASLATLINYQVTDVQMKSQNAADNEN
tara:strand:+ start:45 stop:446 length:402 start_codon:yes stop_codon:yes gene_type:complete